MRNLTAPMAAQTIATTVLPIFLVSIAFAASSVKYMWTGVGTITWNGHDWLGLGDLGTISTISETGELSAQGFTLQLSGIANDLLADSLTEIVVGRPVCLYLGFLDETGSIVTDPYLIRKGRVDEPTTEVGTTESTVSIKVETRLVAMQRASNLRLDAETQRRLFPGDAGLDYISQLVDQVDIWK